ncbi:response regulator transcription factor [Rhizobium laguerreae]|uniref:response regulator transcription factor n=1 Tax=Rhizobium laguerreae TaxID=1076926 RepID=UPI0030090E6A
MPTKRPLIAIVDDDESMRDAIKGLMKSMGFDAESFSSADDFLMSPHIRRTACLVTDINMPGTSGVDLHRRLVALGKSIPTILITAFPEKNIRASALGADVVRCLTKPFNGQILLDCIRSALAPNGEGESGS